MFNKKKKHWYSHKPTYKRENKDAPAENALQPVSEVNEPPLEESSELQESSPEDQKKDQIPEEPVNTAAESRDPAAEITESAPSADVQCPICTMPIRNRYTAIRRKESGELSHFDCVLRELSRENSQKLGKFKRIYYIGSGDFAIVKEFFDKRGHLKNYEIIEKINYENRA